MTYGCYGIIENDTSIKSTHYIADAYGYRIITPGEQIEVYRQPENGLADESGLNDVEPGTHHSNLKIGRFTPWGQLYFPKGCNSLRAPNGTIVYLPGVPKIEIDTEKPINVYKSPTTSGPKFTGKLLLE